MDLIQQYHSILGIRYPATQEQIKKAFYKLAHVHHPDKGGDEEVFKKINNAYTVLMKDAYWHVLAEERERRRAQGQSADYSEHDRRTGKKTHRGKSEEEKAWQPLIFVSDDGKTFWTEDKDGYVKSFYGEPAEMAEEVYH